ncbi:hypothetical protein EVJ58_g3916 [Rhodofomes roseus]|uniref:Uncharacterized protein n=1 Tax=Rhodofomes roseus TaxID=34475 RepID=A0A4Y9YKP3_9APHY|nr:hypothetical protein EVJ58_g3916 [Rhodofomes roseus]
MLALAIPLCRGQNARSADGFSFPAFVNARSWLADVREHADPHLTCILVGNKIDLCSEAAHGTGQGRRARAR